MRVDACVTGWVITEIMAAVSLTDPLCKPCSYSPRFKVELCVKKPLRSISLSSEQVALEMLSFCGQMDLLIRAQVYREQLKQDISPEESEWFQKQGAEIIYQMNQSLEHLSKPVLQLEEYLDAVGLSTLFPRVEVYIINGSPVDMLERPPSDAYFPHIGRLNQLLVLSQQLDEDIKHLGSHKYIAHQLSAIYQVLTTFKGISPLCTIRKDIEGNFKQLKTSLLTDEGSKMEPQLSAQYVAWVSDVTHNLISTVLSLSEELTEDLNPVMEFVSNLS